VIELKYAIPSQGKKGLEEELGYHFGKSPFFTIWDEKTNEIEVIENSSEHFGGIGLPAEFLAKQCNGLICGGIGSRAISLCSELGLKVFVGAEGKIKEVIADFTAGRLREATMDDGCSH
jgi:predicted Fe-Mo cluster-binding NifX family protein